MIEAFSRTLNYKLDDFQLEAIEKIDRGNNVLVCAPTGSGKTVIAQYAIYKAVAEGKKVIYTTPIKALSNQKYSDLTKEYADKVGLLTGDVQINSNAQIMVMTTEVLRNMIYENSADLKDLAYVILDEIHYLADEFRGPIWEEIIIHLDLNVAIVGLSATVSNMEQFANWIGQCRYHCDLVSTSSRPVPLHYKMLVNEDIYELFDGDKLNAKLERAIQKVPASTSSRVFRPVTASESKILKILQSKQCLPAIFFIFSRKGCEVAMWSCLEKKLDLTNASEKQVIDSYIKKIYESLELDKNKILAKQIGFKRWANALKNGYATHHAGLLPVMKETVEELFAAGKLKAVFATSTLALGVNMPAKTVFIDSMYKWNGKNVAMLTPIEFTQLAGRAGRRGIDTTGNVIVLYDGKTDPQDYYDIATSKDYTLYSAFKPTYNMVVNLLNKFSVEQAQQLLQSSFAQYQADSSIGALSNQIKDLKKQQKRYLSDLECEYGDYLAYAKMRKRLKEEQKHIQHIKYLKQKQNNEMFFDKYCRTGAIFSYKKGRKVFYCMAVSKLIKNSGDQIYFSAITSKGYYKKFDITGENMQVSYLCQYGEQVPSDVFHSKSLRHQFANKILRYVKNIKVKPIKPAKATAENNSRLKQLQTQLYENAVSFCPDKHIHDEAYRNYDLLQKQIRHCQQLIEGKTNNITKTMNNILKILLHFNYVDEQMRLTDKGLVLADIYCENDLLIAEAILSGYWHNVTPTQLAMLVSTNVFSGKTENYAKKRHYSREFMKYYKQSLNLCQQIIKLQEQYNLSEVHELDLTLASPLEKWCDGKDLQDSLVQTELTAGDFVRWCKQIRDGLSQIERAGIETISDTATVARGKMYRDIVAWSGL